LAAVYMLWMFQRVLFGPITNEENEKLTDLNMREVGLLIPLVLFMVWIGVRPIDFTQYSEGWVDTYITNSEQKSVAVLDQADLNELPNWTAKVYSVEEHQLDSQLIANKKD